MWVLYFILFQVLFSCSLKLLKVWFWASWKLLSKYEHSVSFQLHEHYLSVSDFYMDRYYVRMGISNSFNILSQPQYLLLISYIRENLQTPKYGIKSKFTRVIHFLHCTLLEENIHHLSRSSRLIDFQKFCGIKSDSKKQFESSHYCKTSNGFELIRTHVHRSRKFCSFTDRSTIFSKVDVVTFKRRLIIVPRTYFNRADNKIRK